MNLLLNTVSKVATNVAEEVSTFCLMFFYEPEVPESLREE